MLLCISERNWWLKVSILLLEKQQAWWFLYQLSYWIIKQHTLLSLEGHWFACSHPSTGFVHPSLFTFRIQFTLMNVQPWPYALCTRSSSPDTLYFFLSYVKQQGLHIQLNLTSHKYKNSCVYENLTHYKF